MLSELSPEQIEEILGESYDVPVYNPIINIILGIVFGAIAIGLFSIIGLTFRLDGFIWGLFTLIWPLLFSIACWYNIYQILKGGAKDAEERYKNNRIYKIKIIEGKRLLSELVKATQIDEMYVDMATHGESTTDPADVCHMYTEAVTYKDGILNDKAFIPEFTLNTEEGWGLFIKEDNNDLILVPIVDFRKIFDSFYLDQDGKIKNKALNSLNGILPTFRLKNENFLFFAREGDFYLKSTVKGAGGGTDYAGALIGGALFGGVGAVVASRNPISIDTTHEEVDKRATYLFYQSDEGVKQASFSSNSYASFRKLFPTKDAIVQEHLGKSEDSH